MRRFVLLGSLATALAALAACGGGSEAPVPPPEGAAAEGPRDALVVAWTSDIGNLNPIVYETASDSEVLQQIMMQPLEATFDCRLTYQPGLYATSTFDETGTVLTHTLRDDLKWSDGQPVTAQDVVFTYALVRDPAVASPRLAYVEHLKEGSPRAIDDHTVVFEFTHPYDRTTMTAHTSLTPMPAHVFESADHATLRGHPKSLDPVVDGPWRLKLHEKGARFVLEPNPDFTGPAELKPKLKRVVFEILPEYTTRLNKLTSGEVDLMESINIEDVDEIRAKYPQIRIASRGYRTSDHVAWNTTRPLFASKEVRRALSLGIDVPGMMQKLLTGKDGTVYGKRAVGTLTPELCDYVDPSLQPLPYDPEEAKRILAAEGWSDTNADGVLDKGGQPFRFTLVTNSGNKRRADASILIQAALKQIGVQVDLEQREPNTFFQDLRERDYDAALSGWSAGLFVDPSDLWSCDTPTKKQEFNHTGYCNPDVDALIAKGLATPDPVAQVPIWRELQAKVFADQPYTFLWWREELVGVHERFENAQIDVLSLLDHLEDWEVPPEKVKYTR